MLLIQWMRCGSAFQMPFQVSLCSHLIHVPSMLSACPHFLNACLDLFKDQGTSVFASSLGAQQCLVPQPRLYYFQPLLRLSFASAPMPVDASLESQWASLGNTRDPKLLLTSRLPQQVLCKAKEVSYKGSSLFSYLDPTRSVQFSDAQCLAYPEVWQSGGFSSSAATLICFISILISCWIVCNLQVR